MIFAEGIRRALKLAVAALIVAVGAYGDSSDSAEMMINPIGGVNEIGFSPAAAQIGDGQASSELSVTLSQALTVAIAVTLTTHADSTVTEGDWSFIDGCSGNSCIVTINAGETAGSFGISIATDVATVEAKTVALTFTGAAPADTAFAGGAAGKFIATIPVFREVCNRSEAVIAAIAIQVRETDCRAISRDDLTGVSFLFLHSREIESIAVGDFSGLSDLRWLDLSNNALTELPAGIFGGLNHLQRLYLTNNTLTVLPADLFIGLGSLQQLYLSDNALTTLPIGIFNELTSLRHLDLRNNNFNPPLTADMPVFSGLPPDVYIRGTVSVSPIDIGFQPVSIMLVAGQSSSELSITLSRALTEAIAITLTTHADTTADDTDWSFIGDCSGNRCILSLTAGATAAGFGMSIAISAGVAEEKSVVLTFAGNAPPGVAYVGGAAGKFIAVIPPFVNVCQRSEAVRRGIMSELPPMDCMTVGPAELISVRYLYLVSESLQTLIVGDFSGLSHLQGLILSNNALTDLPAGLFAGLDKLEWLYLDNNALTTLPVGIFDDLRSLQYLDLSNNNFTPPLTGESPVISALPASVYILGTASIVEIGFVPVSAQIIEGQASSGLSLTLSRALSEAVAITLTAHTDTTVSDADWSFTAPCSGNRCVLPVAAGVTAVGFGINIIRGAATVTAKQVALTFTAPARTDVVLTARAAGEFVATIPTFAEVCHRTSAVVSAITMQVGKANCAAISREDLSGIVSLAIERQGLQSLAAGDFDGLSGLEQLYLINNELTQLPANIFYGLSSLQVLSLRRNNLTALPANIFTGLNNLRRLNLRTNALTALPAGIFNNFSDLRRLDLRDNNFNPLLTGESELFSGLPPDVSILGTASIVTIGFTPTEAQITEGESSSELSIILSQALPEMITITLAGHADTTINDAGWFFTGDCDGVICSLPVSAGATAVGFAISVIDGVATVTANRIVLTLAAAALTDVVFDSGAAGRFTATIPTSANVCARAAAVRNAIMTQISAENCATITPEELIGVTALELQSQGLQSLTAGDLSGLSSLQVLDLSDNTLTALPEGVFDELEGLQTLNLADNALTALFDDIFDNLKQLRYLDLRGNNFTPPLTEGSEIFSDLRQQRATIWGVLISVSVGFAPAGARIAEGEASSGLSMTLSRALREETTITLAQHADTTIHDSDWSFTGDCSGTVCSLPVSAGATAVSFGISIFASVATEAVNSLVLTLMPADRVDVAFDTGAAGGFIVTIPTSANVCARTEKVQDELIGLVSKDNCLVINRQDLSGVLTLELQSQGLQSLTAGDFSDLVSLQALDLSGNNLAALPEGIFDDLDKLQKLNLANNTLTALFNGIFDNLKSLRYLDLRGNNFVPSLTEDSSIFSGLLEEVTIRGVTISVSIGFMPAELLIAEGEGSSGLSITLSRALTEAVTITLAKDADTTIHDAGWSFTGDCSGGECSLPINAGATAVGFGISVVDGVITVRAKRLALTLAATASPDVIFDTDVAGKFIATISTFLEVCDRTEAVRQAIEGAVGKDCTMISREDLRSIGTLNIRSKKIRSLIPGDFDGLENLKWLYLDKNRLTALPVGVFDGLHRLQRLYLGSNDLTTLSAGVFDGLHRLDRLYLGVNNLTTLPAGIFDDLHNLQRLYLKQNALTTLPAGIFGNLSKLQWLNLKDNNFNPLLARDSAVFDGLPAGVHILGIDGLAKISFAPLSSSIDDGQASSGLSVILSQPLTEAITITLTSHADTTVADAAWSFTGDCSGNHCVLPVSAGVTAVGFGISITSGVATVTAKSVVLTFTGDVETNFVFAAGVAGKFVATIPLFVSVCDRTQAVQDEIKDRVDKTDCKTINRQDLRGVALLEISEPALQSLAVEDFADLDNLESLYLTDSALTTLPVGIFAGLDSLSHLELDDNALTTLPAGIFGGLVTLQYLSLGGNTLTTLPAGIFDDLGLVEELYLYDNSLTELSVGVFAGLENLRTLLLNDNALTTLPVGIFGGLNSLSHLDIRNNNFIPPLTGDSTVFFGLPAGIDIQGTASIITIGFGSTGALIAEGEASSGLSITLSRALTEEITITLAKHADTTLSDGDWSFIGDCSVTVCSLPVSVGATAVNFGISIFAGVAAEEVNSIVLTLAATALPDVAFDAGVSGKFIATIATSANVCARTSAVITAIMMEVEGTDCAVISREDLERVMTLDLQLKGLESLSAGDFSGLISLQVLDLRENALTELPAGIFNGLESLRLLDLRNNNFAPLLRRDASVFSGLSEEVVIRGAVSYVTIGFAPAEAVIVEGRSSSGLGITLSRALSEEITIALTRHTDTTAEDTDWSFIGDCSGTVCSLPVNAGETVVSFGISVVDEVATVTAKSIVLTLAATAPSDVIFDTGVAGEFIATIPVFIGVCDRTEAVRDEIMREVDKTNCDEVNREDLRRVRGLYLGDKGLQSLVVGDFAGLENLRELYLYSNDLTELPAGIFAGLENLWGLHLGGNALTELPVSVFAGLENLGWLNFGGNALTELPVSVFAGLENLKRIELNDNDLTELSAGTFAGLENVFWLDLGGNDLTELPVSVFAGLENVLLLYLNDNNITELPAGVFAGLENLESLYLNNNALMELSVGIFADIENLESLYLGGNALTELPVSVFAGLENLGRLNLGGNALTELPVSVFAGLENLGELNLDGNALTELPVSVFVGLENLVWLYLNDNNLTELPAGVFAGLENLAWLYLNNNALMELPVSVFVGLENLVWLYLNDNNLTELPAGIFDFFNPSRQYVDLDLRNNDFNPPLTRDSEVFSGLSWVNVHL